MGVLLHGYRYSVYTRIVRMALAERGLGYRYAEIDPFADPTAPEMLALHPFGRVPILDHDGFRLWETSAILRYLDAAFPGPALVPTAARAAARMEQVIGIVDDYGYRPMVRMVFSHAVFRPAAREPVDPARIAQGLAESEPVLAALEVIAAEGLVLNGDVLTLADLHLAPMLGYFRAAPAGDAMLHDYPRLEAWFTRISQRDCYRSTDPGLPG